MNISLHWLNQYLSPAGVTVEEADEVLTHAGLPIEGVSPPGHGRDTGDAILDVEVTSNRMDCLNHLGCAREIAASPKASVPRMLVYPQFSDPTVSGSASDHLTLDNRHTDACPLFTARVIRGCKVGPSPAWLAERLEAVGQRSINNVVDVTNFITLELGNPCHVFDHRKLAGQSLVIRYAAEGEKLTTLDEKVRDLKPTDLVVADAERPQSLAGVMGGYHSQVETSTTDVVFEMATWDPVVVRTQSRRMNITTDAGYRFQRGVDPRTIDFAARRAVALICELTGGTLCEGVLTQGRPMPQELALELRLGRARLLTGVDIPAGEAIHLLRALEIDTTQRDEDTLVCVVPPHRSRDLSREVDLIEELARTRGFDRVPTSDAIAVRVRQPQARRRAITHLGHVLTGLGFDETVTFAFTSPKRAALFTPRGTEPVSVDDARRGDEPTLRPSVLAGLLQCRQANQDARSAPPGTVRLFEIAAAFGQTPFSGAEPPRSVERQQIAILMDVPGNPQGLKRSHEEKQTGLRAMRGVLDALVRTTHGPAAVVEVEPCREGHLPCPAWDAAACGVVSIVTPGAREPVPLGVFGVLSQAAHALFSVDVPVLAAEIALDPLVAGYPPRSLAHALPSFPAIERDLSLVVDEPVTWAQISGTVTGLTLDRLESLAFVGTFRGTPIDAGKKSVTLRMTFRDAQRTLRHEEVDTEVHAVVDAARARLGAVLRV